MPRFLYEHETHPGMTPWVLNRAPSIPPFTTHDGYMMRHVPVPPWSSSKLGKGEPMILARMEVPDWTDNSKTSGGRELFRFNIVNTMEDLDSGNLDGIESLDRYPFLGAPLLEALKPLGLKRRDPVGYQDGSVLPVFGSVGTHDDFGLGPVISWLVYADEEKRNGRWEDDPELLQGGIVLRPKVGDIFLFNADEDHAWLFNSGAILVQYAVSVDREVATRP